MIQTPLQLHRRGHSPSEYFIKAIFHNQEPAAELFKAFNNAHDNLRSEALIEDQKGRHLSVLGQHIYTVEPQ